MVWKQRRRVKDHWTIGVIFIIFLYALHLCYSDVKFRDPARRLLSPRFSSKTLIIYVYHETPNAKENLEFFLRHALHESSDFVFVLQGDSTVNIPQAANIRVIQKENECLDFGRWGDVAFADGNDKAYDHFLLINASVRGPFVPLWSNDCWVDIFTRRLTSTNRLVGTVLDCGNLDHPPFPQSMIIAVDQVGLSLIRHLLTCKRKMQEEAIDGGEVLLGEVVREAGYTYDTLITASHATTLGNTAADFAVGQGPYTTAEGRCNFTDVNRSMAYFGFDIHPFEVIFIKANRHINDQMLSEYTRMYDENGYSSVKTCDSKLHGFFS